MPPAKVVSENSTGKRSKRSKETAEVVKPGPKPRKNAKKAVVEVETEPEKSDKSASESEEEEPTPKKRKGGRPRKDAVKTPKTPGRKATGRQPPAPIEKPPRKKPGRKAKSKDTFVELTNNEWEHCAFPSCKPPKLDAPVNWVQCDDCDQWYHLICAFGRDDRSVLEEQFHCGCLKDLPTATATAVMA